MYMKFRIALISVTSLILGACTEQQTSEVIVGNSIGAGASDSKAIHVCLDKVIETPTNSSKNGKALVISKLWENGQTIKVKFLSGSASIQDRVWEQAVKWEEYANIKFELVTSGEADIRINIDDSNASWSYLGTDTKFIDQDAPTMNFGWFYEDTLESEIRRTTLHEFGHALGAIHEHQSPAASILWDEEFVIKYYASEFGWSESQTRSDFFDTYSQLEITNSEYDPDSIMHYSIDNSFTLDDFSVGLNYDLSELDKRFIGETYPFEKNSTNLALGKVTEQISTDESGDSSRAVDGNTSGYWADDSITHTAREFSPWWQVRLGKEYAIGDINIYNRINDCCKSRLTNFDVFIYNDAGELVYKTTITETPNPMVTINASGVIGSRVRVKLKDVNILSLAEVEVFEF